MARNVAPCLTATGFSESVAFLLSIFSIPEASQIFMYLYKEPKPKHLMNKCLTKSCLFLVLIIAFVRCPTHATPDLKTTGQCARNLSDTLERAIV